MKSNSFLAQFDELNDSLMSAIIGGADTTEAETAEEIERKKKKYGFPFPDELDTIEFIM